MQGALALHRVNEAHLVHALGKFREEIADPATALTVLSEGPIAALAIAGLRSEEGEFAISIEGLALALREFRLVVEGVQMTHATGAKDLDNSLRRGGVMAKLRCQRVGRSLGIAIQQRGQCGSAEALEEVPACGGVHQSEMDS